MTPDVQAAANRIRAYVEALDHERATLAGRKHFFVDGRIDERHGSDGNTHVLYRGDLRALLAALDPDTRADYTEDSTQIHAALTAEPLTLEDTDAIRRTRDYLGVHLRVHGPHTPIATIDESIEPGGFLWQLTAADLGRTLVPAAPHTTYEGMQALRRHTPLTDEPCGVVPTPAGTATVNAYRAHRTRQHPRGGEAT